MPTVAREQRFTRKSPCPICGGGEDLPRGKGRRCSGFLSADGRYARCTREEHAGPLELDQATDPPTFLHRLEGDCRCGVSHGFEFSPNGRGEIVATYDYVDEVGEFVFQVCRFEPKRFLQRRPDGRGGYHWNLDGVRRVLYRLPTVVAGVKAGEEIWIAEGEKDVEALERAGVIATCNSGGAGKWRAEYAESLRGAHVVIVPDFDEPGREHARRVAAALVDVAASIDVRLPCAGKDAAEHLDEGYGIVDFDPVGLEVIDPEPTDPVLEAEAKPPFSITVYSARELAELELPLPAEPIAGAWLRRAMATLIGGLTGHGKTTFIVHLLKRAADGGDYLGEVIEGGAHALVLDLEQHLASIQRELREAGLQESDAIDYAPIPEGLALNKRSDQLAAVEELLAAKRYDILVIDPFYKLHEADSSDELQARLLVALLRRWISEYGFALLTATHCRKLPAGRTAISLDDLFGSSLFTRDPELVLGIQRHGTLTKLHVFKSREPGLEAGDVVELLFSRERGFWPKPTKDPDELEAEMAEIAAAVVAYVEAHPGGSTRAVQRGVPYGNDRVKVALAAQVQSGLLPKPLRGSRGAHAWYPLNHAALTAPESLIGAVTADSAQASSEATAPDRPTALIEGGRQGSAVAEAETEDPQRTAPSPLQPEEPRDPGKHPAHEGSS